MVRARLTGKPGLGELPNVRFWPIPTVCFSSILVRYEESSRPLSWIDDPKTMRLHFSLAGSCELEYPDASY